MIALLPSFFVIFLHYRLIQFNLAFHYWCLQQTPKINVNDCHCTRKITCEAHTSMLIKDIKQYTASCLLEYGGQKNS